MSEKKRLWKFLRTGAKSNHNGHHWEVGQWYRVPAKLRQGDIVECKGFNCSEHIPDALRYVQGEILAEVEVKGKCHIGERKQTWEWMRLVRTWEWTAEMSVRLAVFAAEAVLPRWTAQYPDDDRPAKAIEAAKRWLKEPTESNAAAAGFAESAAEEAVEDAARAAARTAAGKDMIRRCHEFVLTMLGEAA